MTVERPDWRGRTVVCIASGPSLTREDCEAVRSLPCIVTNTSFRLAPWADVVFGFDAKWWAEYHEEVASICTGRRMSMSRTARWGVESLYGVPWFTNFHNSGACAIGLAMAGGAARVVLIGFDCQRTGGRTHWHGDHPPSMSNAASIRKWPAVFGVVAKRARAQGVPVINASRATALTCFERIDLQAALEPELAAA